MSKRNEKATESSIYAYKKPGRPRTKPEANNLFMLYQQMTAKEIAKFYGVAESTVKHWLWEYRHDQRN